MARAFRVLLCAALGVALLAVTLPGLAQAEQPVLDAVSGETASAAVPEGPFPIPAAEIPDRASEVATFLREIDSKVAPDPAIVRIRTGLAVEAEVITVLEERTTQLLQRAGGRNDLQEAERQWQRIATRIDAWLKTIQERTENLDLVLADGRSELELFEVTAETAEAQDLPETLVENIEGVIERLGSVQESLRARRSEVLTLKAEVTELRARIDEALNAMRVGVAERGRNLLSADALPLWTVLSRGQSTFEAAAEMGKAFSEGYSSVVVYVGEEWDQVLAQIFFVVALLVLIGYLRRVSATRVEAGESEGVVPVLQHPIAAAVLIAFVVSPWFHPRAPLAWESVVTLILLGAAIRLIPLMVKADLARGLSLLLMVFVVSEIHASLPEGGAATRLVLLLLIALTAGGLFWVNRTTRGEGDRVGWVPVRALANVALALLAIALVANVSGRLGLAYLVAEGVLESVWSGLLVWIGVHVFRDAFGSLLLTPPAQKLRIVSRNGERVNRSVSRLVGFLAVVWWLAQTLRGFRVFDLFVGGVWKGLTADIAVGDLEVQPLDLLVFVLAIWLSFKISALLRFVLEEDVMSRMELPAGVGIAVSKGVHYVVVVVGFVIAVAAAGFDLSKVTLVISALGVGIGFGLQGVVNNLVSGVILMIERPIKIGDTVKVSNVEGVVTEIGLRATIIRAWDGAEVIMPNAVLTSTDVTNWTRSDQQRRCTVGVGVGFGSDVERVMQLLLDVARQHPEVDDEPAPYALFLGFGENTLNFEMRCWTLGSFLQVRSEITAGVERALREAGIEIPFPQRTVHMHSDEGAAGKEESREP